MDVSIGIMAYNEEKNISNILDSLLKQKLKDVSIKEIIIVSSGSTDKTNEIVKRYVKRFQLIRLIKQKDRNGKALAVNEFINNAKSNILILESADTIPREDTIENICEPFKDEKVGIVASKPIPSNGKKDFLSFVVNLQWALHHHISLKKPKYGELIAFRNLFKGINKTAVDEEYISMLIHNLGFKGTYANNAVIYNFSPKTVSDFIRQRRRIYCGHLRLKKKNNYKVPTLNNFFVFGKVIKFIHFRNIHMIIIAIILEAIGRFLGIIDYYANKRHHVWEVSKTTKS